MQEAYSGLPADGENPLLLESNHEAGEKCPAVGADLMILLLGYSLSLETQVTEAAGVRNAVVRNAASTTVGTTLLMFILCKGIASRRQLSKAGPSTSCSITLAWQLPQELLKGERRVQGSSIRLSSVPSAGWS